MSAIVNRSDVVTACYAVPMAELQYRKKREGKIRQMKFWRILLDSGSDGDIIFLKKNCKQKFPIKRRHEPQEWQTSAGTFKTDKIASVELLFPEYSHSKIVTVKTDVINYETDQDRPNYDVIIGRSTMRQLGAVLDFKEKVIEWDGVKLPLEKSRRIARHYYCLQFL